MPLGYVKKLASYIGAKSAETVLPFVMNRPELLGPMVTKLKDIGIDNIRRKSDFPPKMLERKVDSINMLWEMVLRQLPNLAPNVKRKLIFNLWYHNITKGEETRDRYRAKYGEWPPTLLVISPSMRCNLRCEGCYAAEYQKFGELSKEEFIALVRQAKEDLGIHFFTILGGEPTAWPPLWECLEELDDVFFQVYTHGMLIDKEMADRAAKLGNVTFAISIEGTPEETDARRGPGAYERITQTMRTLREAGVLFGFSATHTTKNHASVSGQAFYKDMLDRGAAFGWVFQYVPMGRGPNMDMVVSAEQRIERWKAIDKFRQSNPIVLFDFWNDGEITDGCMAYGRRYMHVLSSGMVEPCVFVHFAKDNIRDKKLIDIVQSPWFVESRKRAPFDADRRAPCSFLDNPDFIKEMYHKHDLKASHDGAESIVTDLHDCLVERAGLYRAALEKWDAEEGGGCCGSGCSGGCCDAGKAEEPSASAD